MTEKNAATQTAPEPAVQVKIVEPQTLAERMNKLSEKIAHRAYELFEGRGRMFGHDLEDWFQAESEVLTPLQLRIKEQNEALTVEAEVPGFNAKELEVALEPWRLTISGKKETKEEQKKGKAVYQEQTYEQFMRVIDLPAQVETAKAKATLKNGVLEVTVPKVTEAITKKVEVKAA